MTVCIDVPIQSFLPVTVSPCHTYQTSTFWGYTQLPYISVGFFSLDDLLITGLSTTDGVTAEYSWLDSGMDSAVDNALELLVSDGIL